jgi:hypothetical protein
VIASEANPLAVFADIPTEAMVALSRELQIVIASCLRRQKSGSLLRSPHSI